MYVALLLDTKKGSEQWHQEMTLAEHLEVVDREYCVGQPFEDTRRTLRRLGVYYYETDRSSDSVDRNRRMNPSASGSLRIVSKLYPPERVGMWSPTEIYFYFDNDHRLSEIWSGLRESDDLHRKVMARLSGPSAASVSPEGLWPVPECGERAYVALVRVLPPAPILDSGTESNNEVP